MGHSLSAVSMGGRRDFRRSHQRAGDGDIPMMMVSVSHSVPGDAGIVPARGRPSSAGHAARDMRWGR